MALPTFDTQQAPTPAVGGRALNASADALVKTGPGDLVGIFVASGTPTIKVWDNTSGATTVLVNTFQAAAGVWYPLPFHFSVGCYVDVTGTCDYTVSYH